MTQHELSLPLPPDPDPIEVVVDAFMARQPIGDVILAKFPFREIIRISFFDVRRLVQDERDVEKYLGIQRPLIPSRVASLEKYVNFSDATFPTAIIIAIEEDYAEYDPKSSKLKIRNYKKDEGPVPTINIRRVARVIDGQHRIAGLMKFNPTDKDAAFDVPVTVFVGADIADQAYVFSTVNLEQTKVSKSLAIDLYELAETRSPFKTCHFVAVALDQDEGSLGIKGPLCERIKRLGFATEGRVFEPITQANFVDTLIPYISSDPKGDRDVLLRGRRLERASPTASEKLIFRNMFIEERDVDIARTVSEFFYAVRDRWPVAWDNKTRGQVLNRTNGIRALIRSLRYFYLKAGRPEGVVMRDRYLAMLREVPLEDRNFTVDEFPPGTSGEARLKRILTGEEVYPPEKIRG